MKSHFRNPLARLLLIVLLFNSFAGLVPTTAQAQNRIIVVNADQPNVWTLEQAHYLLAQMHRRNLDLRAKALEDLDANAINGLNFEVFRQLTEIAANFNQADLVNNRAASRNRQSNNERRQLLLNRRDKLQEEQLVLTRAISQLESEKANATSQEEKDRLTAQITAKTAERAVVNSQIESTNSELTSLGTPSTTLTATEAEGGEFEPDKLPKSTFDKAVEDAAKKQIEMFNVNPQLNATLKLENFLQMQYEIIAKQLTLLRDEVGPGERLLFLELPQTVNVAHHEANKKWAQSWWKIVGYTKKNEGRSERQRQRYAERNKNGNSNNNGGNSNNAGETYQDRLNPAPASTSEKVREILGSSAEEDPRSRKRANNVEFIDLETPQTFSTSRGLLSINDRSVRTVELIPRQSSLNVNDMKLKVKAGALTAVASFLFGFGARLNVQRQREQFTQFVQQELYSSAFGKGSREFGWTFTPMPGTDRLHSGVRTTYAVVVVPEEATSLIVESNGCYFPRSAYQPNDFADTTNSRWTDTNRTSRNCGGNKAFLVPIPGGANGDNDFWVEGLSYQPVNKGERIVVVISGYNFSSQVGALINGVPLLQSIGVAQPFLLDDSRAGIRVGEIFEKEKIRGNIERIDANRLVLSFVMPPDFDETPTITLIAPGKAIDLNWLDNISINGVPNSTLLGDNKRKCSATRPPPCVTIAAPMFRGAPGPPPLRIDSVDVFRNVSGGMLTAIVTGAGFNSTHKLFVNGVDVGVSPATSTLWQAQIPAPPDATIQATLSTSEKTIKSKPVDNPAFLSVRRVSVVSYEAANGKTPAFLVVRIEGSGFNDAMTASVSGRARIEELIVSSSTEATLTIKNPGAAEVVTLTDPRTNLSVKAVVTRKPSKETER